MTRSGITYQQVAAAADAINNEGQQPTVRGVRERLGIGSLNTIHKHMATWRENRPAPAQRPNALPEALMAAVAAELAQAARNASHDLGERLRQAQAEAAELAAAGEAAELDAANQISELTQRVTALTTERDIQAGKVVQLEAAQTDRIREIERERADALAARDALARAELQVDVQADTVQAQAAEIERLRMALDSARNDRAKAEQQAAVLAAKLEAATERAARAEARVAQIEKEVMQPSGRRDREEVAMLAGHLEQALEKMAALMPKSGENKPESAES